MTTLNEVVVAIVVATEFGTPVATTTEFKIDVNLAVNSGTDPKHFPKDYMLHNKVKGAPCPRCGGKIETLKMSGRTAYFCPKCQK